MTQKIDSNDLWILAAISAVALLAFGNRSPSAEKSTERAVVQGDGTMGFADFSMVDEPVDEPRCITLYVWENGAFRPALFCENSDGTLVRVRARGGLGKAV